ncbi:MAG: vWA domain-containing protein [Sphingobacterium sp.]|uniref:vWA domain-containing protein n=1 Tax=Sphingobacterium sp. JB170 TaxID=1434842 RepID=UPI00097F6996|nr:VWA domain-containing protein [Sphingobacterium sp. JB170]SJN48006.1 short form Mg-chelase associated protein with vWA domain [Sphingobacterium sp. JB170]
MRKADSKKGFVFKQYQAPFQTPFDKLFEIFTELLTHTSGDFDEAVEWLRELDREFKLTTPEYTVDDFIAELKEKGYIQERLDFKGQGGVDITSKMEKALRQNALVQIFGNMHKGKSGNHKTKHQGQSEQDAGDFRSYQYGDSLEKISVTESLKNAQVNHGIGDFSLSEADLVVEDTQFKSQMSTVLMIDISHSMILYGEDRITPAKKVAMALSELILTRYPKDSLDVIVFGNDAWPIEIKDLPYLQVGPFHTNTVAGLQLAMDILRRKRHANKQIFMITDGKPSCLRMSDGTYYKNPMGLDPFITSKCYSMAAQARKVNIPITTFMITSDPYLQEFVDKFTASNLGKAYYTGLGNLGEMIFEDYQDNRKKRIR